MADRKRTGLPVSNVRSGSDSSARGGRPSGRPPSGPESSGGFGSAAGERSGGGSPSAAASQRGPKRHEVRPARPRVLVVEDEAIVAKDIESCVSRLGYEVAGRAKNAAEAIRKAVDGRPDLVLMDIRLEGAEDGVFAAREIRRHAADVAVVFLTAYADDDTLQRAKLTEPFGYILKPFDERELRTTIEMALYKHQMERRLRESEQWLAATLRSIGDGVLAADGDEKIVFMNAAAECLMGWTQQDAAGRRLDEVLRVEMEGGAADPVARSRSDDGAVSRVGLLLTRDRTATPVEAITAPILDDQGRRAGVVVAFRDIRERRRIEQQRDQLLAQEREANRLKDEFLAMLSHELRTPLSSILGWSQLLGTGELDEGTARTAFETIERNALQQLDLVDELLDVARISSGQLWLDPHPILVAPLLESALDVVRPAADAKALRIEYVRESAGPVLGDPGRLSQVFANLLSNAVKFTPAGGLIQISLHSEGDCVEVTVRDSGEGISPEFLPHLFERFRQEDSSNTRAHGGVGLGLALVRRLIELHAGSILGESEGKGRGATFTVRLPAAVGSPREGPCSRGEPVRLDGIRVLIVDDESDRRAVVGAMLEAHGATVTVGAAADALEMLRREPADVLLADLQVPGEDGYSLIRRVRALPPEQGGGLPAAALTALAHGDHAERALAAGFQAHVAKPVDATRLAAVVAELYARGKAGSR